MNSVKVCEYSRSRSFHDDLILQDQASGERSQDHWSSGCFIFFLFMFKNIDCGYMLELPRRGGSNEYPQSMFWIKDKKKRFTPADPSFAVYRVLRKFEDIAIILIASQ